MSFISPEWQKLLDPYKKDVFGKKKDKRIDRWQKILLELPDPINKTLELSSEVKIDFDWTTQDSIDTAELLLKLIPWRKGPFSINDVFIDSEWCSNFKWDRFLELNLDMSNKTILDVGSGNGYYGFRMLGLDAKEVLCLEPNLTHFSQFLALNHFVQSKKIQMLPERLESIRINKPYFDVIFSMGLLYHQRDPGEHLRLLTSHLKKEGRIVIETIVTPEDYEEVLIPNDRYANMPNVWSVHNEIGLERIIFDQGLEIIDSTKTIMTTFEEQRTTAWMPFKSFESAVEEDNPERTVEGFPAPLRKFVVVKIQNSQL
jgi:tRNA (mo5U34)-methyltransferase